jgi:hypothetical protein
MDDSREKAVRALELFNAERAGRPGVPAWKLVDEAARHFDLDAAQSEWLLRTVLEAATPDSPTPCPTCGGALQPAKGLEGMSTCGSGHLVRTPA